MQSMNEQNVRKWVDFQIIFHFITFSGVVLSQTIPRRNRDKIIRKFTTTATTTRAPSDDDELSEDCPEPYGFFADADQCDKYHACSEGRIEGNLTSELYH